MPNAIIGIGLPGSGKTTILKQLASKSDAVYVSADSIRERICGDMTDHRQEKEVWKLVYESIDCGLMHGLGVVVDVTNTNPNHRRQMVVHCVTRGATTIGLWVATPVEACLNRNKLRERVVPERVIRRMDSQLRSDPPRVDEGFDHLISINPLVWV